MDNNQISKQDPLWLWTKYCTFWHLTMTICPCTQWQHSDVCWAAADLLFLNYYLGSFSNSPGCWDYAAQRWCWAGFWWCCLCDCALLCWWPTSVACWGTVVTTISQSAPPGLVPVPCREKKPGAGFKDRPYTRTNGASNNDQIRNEQVLRLCPQVDWIW